VRAVATSSSPSLRRDRTQTSSPSSAWPATPRRSWREPRRPAPPTRASAPGLATVRVVAGDARCIVRELVPAASVSAVHVYFPDPWPKTRHRHRRLFDRPDLAEAIRRALLPGGLVPLAPTLS